MRHGSISLSWPAPTALCSDWIFPRHSTAADSPSVLQHIRRRLAQPIPTPYIRERRPRITVPGKIFEVDYIAPPFPRRGQGRDSERVDRHRRIEPEAPD